MGINLKRTVKRIKKKAINHVGMLNTKSKMT
jgi:hypothetical protein